MYYLYRHIRLDKNQVFYVGIGTINKQHKYKRACQKDKRNSIWNSIVSKTPYRYIISPHLYTHQNIFKRIWVALKYIFGCRSRYGAWDEIIIHEDKIKTNLAKTKK